VKGHFIMANDLAFGTIFGECAQKGAREKEENSYGRHLMLIDLAQFLMRCAAQSAGEKRPLF
jgi:hypothetical protein